MMLTRIARGTVPVRAFTETLATPSRSPAAIASSGPVERRTDPEVPWRSSKAPVPTAPASNEIIAAVE